MTDAATMPTRADAQFVHDEWDRRTRAHDIEGLLELYLPDATLESPLVPRVLDQTSGVLHGHDELRSFFVRGTEGRPAGPLAQDTSLWKWHEVSMDLDPDNKARRSQRFYLRGERLVPAGVADLTIANPPTPARPTPSRRAPRP